MTVLSRCRFAHRRGSRRLGPVFGLGLGLGLGIALVSGGCVATRFDDAAPLRVRNQHPVQLTAIHGIARAARPTQPGAVDARLGLDWTSLWLRPGDGANRFEADGEVLRAEAAVRFGLLPSVDVEVLVPVVHASGGTLDGFIEGWHDLFALPQNDRDEFPRNQFRVDAVRRRADGTTATAYALDEGGVRLGDVPIFVTWFPIEASGDRARYALGVRAGVELPTGDERDGYGSGGIDAHLGWVGGVDWIGASLFGWGGRSWVDDPDTARDAGLSIPDLDAAGVGVEWGFLPDLRGIVQVEWERSVLGDLDGSRASRDQIGLWLGGRVRLSDRATLEAGIGEDLASDVSADVTFHVAVDLAFGR